MDDDEPFHDFERMSSIGRASDFFEHRSSSRRTIDARDTLDPAAIAMLRCLKSNGLDQDSDACITLSDMLETLIETRQHRDASLSSNGLCRSDAHFAACAFGQLLVLKTRDVVDVVQQEPINTTQDALLFAFDSAPSPSQSGIGEILITEGPMFATTAGAL